MKKKEKKCAGFRIRIELKGHRLIDTLAKLADTDSPRFVVAIDESLWLGALQTILRAHGLCHGFAQARSPDSQALDRLLSQQRGELIDPETLVSSRKTPLTELLFEETPVRKAPARLRESLWPLHSTISYLRLTLSGLMHAECKREGPNIAELVRAERACCMQLQRSRSSMHSRRPSEHQQQPNAAALVPAAPVPTSTTSTNTNGPATNDSAVARGIRP
ncbi:hypothetical protein HZH68_015398 [Vespula germanica]|uniref:Uncharacterized protein n=1 Tax=Vespula germanica TaxID=30212 RepID=A0A834J620_VESGE|nr:hypothetical protein HZH68_015398 [Vespula germanica]